MELKNAVGLIIGVFVGVLLLATLLIPVVSSVSDENVTYVNDGPRMSPVGDQTITITYSNNVWTVNGIDKGYELGPISQGTIMLYSTASTSRAGYLYTNHDNAYTRSSIANTTTETVEYVGAEKIANITTVTGGNTYTASYPYVGEVYYLDDNGSYSWFGEKPTIAYIPDNWDKFNTWSVQADHFYAIIGNVIMVDGVESPEGVTYTIGLGDIPGINGVKTIDSYVLNIPEQDPIECRGYILPYEVHGIDESKAQYSALWSIIPILGLVALFVPIVYFIGSNRRD